MSPLQAVELADDLAVIIYAAMFVTVALGVFLAVAVEAICARYRASHPHKT